MLETAQFKLIQRVISPRNLWEKLCRGRHWTSKVHNCHWDKIFSTRYSEFILTEGPRSTCSVSTNSTSLHRSRYSEVQRNAPGTGQVFPAGSRLFIDTCKLPRAFGSRLRVWLAVLYSITKTMTNFMHTLLITTSTNVDEYT